MGIADDGGLTVVSRHDHEAVLGIENIESRKAPIGWIEGAEVQAVSLHKLDGNRFCGLQVNRMGHDAKRQTEVGQNKCKNPFHLMGFSWSD